MYKTTGEMETSVVFFLTADRDGVVFVQYNI